MAEFPLLVPKFDDLENESLFKSSWWIFMWKYVNITVYIWSQNLAMCLITKIGGCIRLIRAASPRGQWVNDAPCTVKLWGMDIDFTPSVCLSIPYTVSALWLVAYFMDYIHIWHKYRPWVDDVLHTISRSVGQSQGHTGHSNFFGWGEVYPIDHYTSCTMKWRGQRLPWNLRSTYKSFGQVQWRPFIARFIIANIL